MADISVEVVVQIRGEDVVAGRLWAHRRAGTESATFVYDDSYLAHPDAYALDPSLQLYAGQHQTPGERPMFGALSDCAPDRWGRRLIKRAERSFAERAGRAERSFGEIDYLLGARDDARQGALRLRRAAGEPYLAPEADGVPPLVELPALLSAADRLDRDQADEVELQLLLRGGSSLGGARPKAHVLDRQGRLSIAKFPSASSDEWDVIRWEGVALALAERAGICVPSWRLEIVDSKPVLLVGRFDRDGDWRIGYVSAMTMLELDDGERATYLDIGEAIEAHSPHAGDDLRELWRRLAFTILVSNTDNHLRNHGFLRTARGGWALAPAFDLNPNPEPGALVLNTSIAAGDEVASVDDAIGLADAFGLRRDEAQRMLGEVRAATREWRQVAAGLGLPKPAIEAMRPAFERER